MSNSKEKEFVYLPLGGCGEIGMNLGLYGYGEPEKEKWLMVDCGITFGDPSLYPGVDVMTADTTFIEAPDNIKNLEGIVITHGHEDHIGGLPYLWSKFKVNIYATPFTLELIRSKFEDVELIDEVTPFLKEVDINGSRQVGDFKVTWIGFTHSILEPTSLLIEVSCGKALHTGDWKFDDQPMVGKPVDRSAFSALAPLKIDAIFGDSTNVSSVEPAGSEGEIEKDLLTLVKAQEQKIIVTFFASNLARLDTVAKIADKSGRKLVLLGRSMWRMYNVAKKLGYLEGMPQPLDDNSLEDYKESELLVACTGSQGEPRAALSRMARGNHPRVSFNPGDTVIFSSRVIPGNETSINRIYNSLARLEVKFIKPTEAHIHVSGHPSRTEIEELYTLVKPRAIVPVHGEYIHLQKHMHLAETMGFESTLIENGDIVKIAPGKLEVVDKVDEQYIGRYGREGNRMLKLNGDVMLSRRRALYKGAITISVVVDYNGKLRAEPEITSSGVFDYETDKELLKEFHERITKHLRKNVKETLNSPRTLKENLRSYMRRFLHHHLDLRPVISVHLLKIAVR